MRARSVVTLTVLLLCGCIVPFHAFGGLSLLAAGAPAPTGGITVQVTNSSLAPLQNVTVQIKNSTGGTVASKATDASGAATFTGLAAGTYYVRTSNSLGYVDVWYGNAVVVFSGSPAGAAIVVSDGNTETISLALNQGGRISGSVKNAAGSGISSIQVRIFDAANHATTTTYYSASSTGIYTTDPLPPGTYYARTRNSSGYTDEAYDNLPVWTPTTSGTPIAVTVGGTATANFVLDVNTGPNRIVTAMTIPLGLTENQHYPSGYTYEVIWWKFFVPPEEAGKDLKVQLRVTSPYPVPPPRSSWGSDLDFDLVDADGKVRGVAVSGSDNETIYIHGVSSGWYYIYMNYCTTEYADNDQAAQFSIDVETGTDFGVGYISGRLVDGAGNGVPQVYIEAFSVPANHDISFQTITSKADGTFTIAVPPSARTLYFTGDIFGGRPDLQSHQASVNVVKAYYSGNDVTATAGNTTNLGNVPVTIGAIVKGSMTDSSGHVLSMGSVQAYTPDGLVSTGAWTNYDGTYTLMGIPPGGAKIRFSRWSHAAEYYDDQPCLGAGTLLATQSGVTIDNVNAALTAGGTINGTVQNTAGGAVSANVRLYSVLDPTNYVLSTNSGASTGGFTFYNVKPGQYKIEFAHASVGFLEEWYDDTASFEKASVITVTEGGTVSGILAQLLPVPPEIDVSQAGTPIASGGTQAFGTRMLNTATDLVFTVANSGPGGLTLSGSTLGGADAGQFSIAAYPASSVNPGATTTFTIRFRPTSAGPKNAYVSIVTNDPDENPYVINFTGTGIAASSDFNGDGATDVPWRNRVTGEISLWLMNGTTVGSEERFAGPTDRQWRIVATGDFDNDGDPDLVMRHATTGENQVWYMNGTTHTGTAALPKVADGRWQIVAAVDFNRDGQQDLLWRNTANGDVVVWYLHGATYAGFDWVASIKDLAWVMAGVYDFNGDWKPDIVWRNASDGRNLVWYMDGAVYAGFAWLPAETDATWGIVGVADYSGDGKADLLWRNTATGQNRLWRMDGTTLAGVDTLPPMTDVEYEAIGADAGRTRLALNDFNGDGTPDILWHNDATGESRVWYMAGSKGDTRLADVSIGTEADLNWKTVAVADFNQDRLPDIVWRNSGTGQNKIWLMTGRTKTGEMPLPTIPDANWRIVGVGDFNQDGHPDLAWRNYATGANIIWFLRDGQYFDWTAPPTIKDTNWKIVAVGDFNGDAWPDLFWRNEATGVNIAWFLVNGVYAGWGQPPTIPDPVWRIVGAADYNGDGKADLLWRNATSGQNLIWYLRDGAYLDWAPLPPLGIEWKTGVGQ